MPRGMYPGNKGHKWGHKISEKTKEKIGEANSGEKHGMWGGGKIKRCGYVVVHCPNHPYKDSKQYVAEHRLMMEKHLGRILLPTENVHHINNIRDDNRIENLVLFPNNSEHLKYHARLRHKSKYYDLNWLTKQLRTKKQSQIAKECGVSAAALSAFIRRNYLAERGGQP